MVTEEAHLAALAELREELDGVRQELTCAREAANSQRRRSDALHQAREGWGTATAETAEQYAYRVTFIASALDAFVAAGTVHPVPGPSRTRQESAAGRLDPRTHSRGTPEGLTALGKAMQEGIHRATWTPVVVDAAVDWVRRAHLDHPAGAEHWRIWADEQDIALMNAVLNYLNRPTLERKDPT
jgi:hypothetical protein